MYGSYSKIVEWLDDAATAVAVALEHALGVIRTFTRMEPGTITRFGIRPTVTFNYDTMTQAAIVALKIGTTEIARITLVNGWVAGEVYYVNVDNSLNRATYKAGDVVTVEVVQAGTGGGAIAGDFVPYFCFNHRGEVAANQPKMHNITP